MKQNITINLLPNHFCGFYESHLSGMIECAEEFTLENMKEDLHEQGIEVDNIWDLWDYLDVDYAGAKNYLSISYIDCFKESVKDILDTSIVDMSTVQFDHLWSPKEYNFTTDALYVNVNCSESELVAYASNNLTAFNNYCKDNFKSRDGFISFYSNDPSDWLDGSVKNKCEEIYFTYLVDFYITNSINTYVGPYNNWENGNLDMDEQVDNIYNLMYDDMHVEDYISYDLDEVKLKHTETL